MTPRIVTRAALLGAASVLALASACPAAADPPDYSSFTPVDSKPFHTFSTYGGDGVQFTSPSGLLCRIVIISRGMFAYATCLGDLHGTDGNNLAAINTGGTAGFSMSTRSKYLSAQQLSGDGWHDVQVPDFPALPAGSSLTYTTSVWSGTCAVDATTTSCTVTASSSDHTTSKSFVLTPTDSTIS